MTTEAPSRSLTRHPLQQPFALRATCAYIDLSDIKSLALVSRLFVRAEGHLPTEWLARAAKDLLLPLEFPRVHYWNLSTSSLSKNQVMLLPQIPTVFPNLEMVRLAPQAHHAKPHQATQADGETLQASLACLQPLTKVRELAISNFGMGYGLRDYLPSVLSHLGSRGLHTIILYNLPEVGDDTILHLRNFSQLHTLVLKKLPSLSNKSLSHLTRCESLHKLTLSSCLLSDISLLDRLPKLHTLTLDALPAAAQRDRLVELADCPSLKKLTLRALDALDEATLFSLRERIRRPLTLCIRHCGEVAKATVTLNPKRLDLPGRSDRKLADSHATSVSRRHSHP